MSKKLEETSGEATGDELVTSHNPEHPANLIPELCKLFWTLGWVTGTGYCGCHCLPAALRVSHASHFAVVGEG